MATGGTIAMRYDPIRQGIFPAVTDAELVEAVPPLADVCPVEVLEFSNIPSPHMTPAKMFNLSQAVDTVLEIHSAREVTKTHSANPKTFSSPFWGPIGYVDVDRVIFCRTSLQLQKIQPSHLETDVHLIKLAAGVNGFLLRCLADKGVKGIVVEGLGRGNIPPSVLPGIALALEKNIPVVLTTRVAGGRVLDVYGYKGAVKPLKEMGVILGGEISGQKARLKLMLALGITSDHTEIANFFDIP